MFRVIINKEFSSEINQVLKSNKDKNEFKKLVTISYYKNDKEEVLSHFGGSKKVYKWLNENFDSIFKFVTDSYQIMEAILETSTNIFDWNIELVVNYKEVIIDEKSIKELLSSKAYNVSTTKRYKGFISNIVKLGKNGAIDDTITPADLYRVVGSVRDLHSLLTLCKKEGVKLSEGIQIWLNKKEEQIDRLQTSYKGSKPDKATVNNDEAVADTDSKNTVTINGNIALTIEAYKALDKEVKNDLKKELITAIQTASPAQMVQLLQTAVDAGLISI